MKKVALILGLNNEKAVSVAGVRPNGELLYSWSGNTDFITHLSLPDVRCEIIPLIWFTNPPRKIERPDVLINCINDPDSNSKSLKQAVTLVEDTTRTWPDLPVFNHPARIEETARDAIYKSFHGLPGILLPRTIRIKPDCVAEALRMAQAQDMAFPFLIRPCGEHNSRKLSLITGKGDLKQLESYAYDGQEFYVTSFVDTADARGLYHKARLVMIDGIMHPRHCMFGGNWMVGDTHKSFMAKHPETLKGEQYFIDNWRTMIAPAALASLQTIYARLGLDYLGFDFAIKRDGSLVIFEINAAQNTFIQLDYDMFPYMKAVQDNIVTAFGDAIKDRITRKAIPSATCA